MPPAASVWWASSFLKIPEARTSWRRKVRSCSISAYSGSRASASRPSRRTSRPTTVVCTTSSTPVAPSRHGLFRTNWLWTKPLRLTNISTRGTTAGPRCSCIPPARRRVQSGKALKRKSFARKRCMRKVDGGKYGNRFQRTGVHYLSKFNAMKKLNDIKIAILTENGFEQVELTRPKAALENAGAKVDVISPQRGKVKAWDKIDWGIEVKVDKELANVKPADYDALVLPGGVMNPDKLRQNGDAVNFVKEFLQSGKPIAAICHGPQILIETGLLKGKTMTSFPSLQTDLRNAGVNWVDEEIVHFDNLITSRKPADLDAFNEELIKTLSREESMPAHPPAQRKGRSGAAKSNFL